MVQIQISLIIILLFVCKQTSSNFFTNNFVPHCSWLSYTHTSCSMYIEIFIYPNKKCLLILSLSGHAYCRFLLSDEIYMSETDSVVILGVRPVLTSFISALIPTINTQDMTGIVPCRTSPTKWCPKKQILTSGFPKLFSNHNCYRFDKNILYHLLSILLSYVITGFSYCCTVCMLLKKGLHKMDCSKRFFGLVFFLQE